MHYILHVSSKVLLKAETFSKFCDDFPILVSARVNGNLCIVHFDNLFPRLWYFNHIWYVKQPLSEIPEHHRLVGLLF